MVEVFSERTFEALFARIPEGISQEIHGGTLGGISSFFKGESVKEHLAEFLFKNTLKHIKST